MTYYGARELAESFETVRRNTIQVAQDIPEEHYGFRSAAESRTVEKLFTHIALSYKFEYQIHAVEARRTLEGFDFLGLMETLSGEEAQSRTKAELIDLLTSEGETWSKFVRGVSEEFLEERVEFPEGATPPSKSRFEMILSVKEHEMHHRGQLMLIERMVGVVPHLTRQRQERMAQVARERGA